MKITWYMVTLLMWSTFEGQNRCQNIRYAVYFWIWCHGFFYQWQPLSVTIPPIFHPEVMIARMVIPVHVRLLPWLTAFSYMHGWGAGMTHNKQEMPFIQLLFWTKSSVTGHAIIIRCALYSWPPGPRRRGHHVLWRRRHNHRHLHLPCRSRPQVQSIAISIR